MAHRAFANSNASMAAQVFGQKTQLVGRTPLDPCHTVPVLIYEKIYPPERQDETLGKGCTSEAMKKLIDGHLARMRRRFPRVFEYFESTCEFALINAHLADAYGRSSDDNPHVSRPCNLVSRTTNPLLLGSIVAVRPWQVGNEPVSTATINAQLPQFESALATIDRCLKEALRNAKASRFAYLLSEEFDRKDDDDDDDGASDADDAAENSAAAGRPVLVAREREHERDAPADAP